MAIDISGLSKKKVLIALFDGARSGGIGHLDPTGNRLSGQCVDLTEQEAREILTHDGGRVDYIRGRSVKVRIVGDELTNEHLYDRDNGAGAVQGIVNHLRAEMNS